MVRSRASGLCVPKLELGHKERRSVSDARLPLCILVLVGAYTFSDAAGAPLDVRGLTALPRVGEVCELGVSAPTSGVNPFDPDAATLDAEVVAPSGRAFRLPGFYMVPHNAVTVLPAKRIAQRMRVFISTHGLRKGHRTEMLLDDLRLVDRDTEEEVVLDDFEEEQPWMRQWAEVGVETERARSGKRCVRMGVTVGERRGWPGMGREVGGADWQRFGELRFWVCPVKGLEGLSPGIEFYTPEGEKRQRIFSLVGVRSGEWREIVWRFRTLRDTVAFEPAGEPEWRVRFTPWEAGEHTARFTFRDVSGTQRVETSFGVLPGKVNGFVQISHRDRRYLEFHSGEPYLAVGMNLLGKELGHYGYFLDRLATAKCNFIRIWLSPRTLGFELAPGEYAQDKCAQFDRLLDMCQERGIYVMACLTDFREVCSFSDHGYWEQSPFNVANSGPCFVPEDFFRRSEAKKLYRRKLRYSVARWAAHPNLMSWEFFNEVNITEGWREIPDEVRVWHREMGEYLRALEPYDRPITSSFAGIEDDVLWEQPNMDIPQRHFYLTPGNSFVDYAASAQTALARHCKPALIGEFGRRRNEFGEIDSAGVSLHNGLWASVMSGGCGTAMTWWWGWVDEHGLWRKYADVQRFVEGVDWPAEQFAALEGTVACDPDPQVGFGSVRVSPKLGSFKPAAFNAPVTVTMGPGGEPDQPDLVARIQHGIRNHRALHNPVTFEVDSPRCGEFAAHVAGVSRHGGAGLTISVDGRVELTEDFPSRETDSARITRYDGRYAVPIPAGKHRVTVQNPGKDWFIVAVYEFVGLRSEPPLRLLGLRGRRTMLAWLWNETHLWYSPVLKLPRARLRQASATLRDVSPGRWRVQSYDPWTGEWGPERKAEVGADGKLVLAVEALAQDVAWRLERGE